MSGDLISRKALLDIFSRNSIFEYITNAEGKNVIQIIEEQPTAYDTEKAIEQLEELREMVPINRLLDDIIKDKPKELGQLMAYRKAIEIVKSGGVAND